MRPAFSRAHGKLENYRVVETRRDVTTFSLETLRVANHRTVEAVTCTNQNSSHEHNIHHTTFL